MQPDKIVNLLRDNQHILLERGVRSLAWIDPGSMENRHPLHLLVKFASPVSYRHFQDLTAHLTELLQHPVELVLVDREQPAVEPYLDPDAIVLL